MNKFKMKLKLQKNQIYSWFCFMKYADKGTIFQREGKKVVFEDCKKQLSTGPSWQESSQSPHQTTQ